MNHHSTFRLPWDTFWVLKKEHTEPLWAQLAVGAILALSICFCMMLINGMLTGRLSELFWWRGSLPFS